MSDVLAEAQSHLARREGLLSDLREEEARLVARIEQVRVAIASLALGDSFVAGHTRDPMLARSEDAPGPRPTRRRSDIGHKRRASLAMEDRVLDLIRQHGGPLPSTELRSKLGLGQTTVSRATRELMRRGLIRASVVRSRGAPLAFEAVPSPSSSTASASGTRTAPATAGASTGGPR